MSELIPEWEAEGIPEDTTAEPEDAGDGTEEANDDS